MSPDPVDRLRERVREAVGDSFKDGNQTLADPQDAIDVLAAIVEELGVDDKLIGDAVIFEEVARGTTTIADIFTTLLRASRTEEPTEGAPRSRGESDE